jgi:hypothetical protein
MQQDHLGLLIQIVRNEPKQVIAPKKLRFLVDRATNDIGIVLRSNGRGHSADAY